MKTIKLLFIIELWLGLAWTATSQDFKFNPRYSYYTTENQAEILVVLPEGDPVYPVKLSIGMNNQTVYQADTIVKGLVDGQSGTRNYSDGKWQGFNGQDLKVIIDQDSIQTVRKVSSGFLQDIAAWIFMPLKVVVAGSIDGKNFKLIGTADNPVDEHARGAIRKDFVVELNPVPVRYLRMKATNRRICPDWHNGKGKSAFIFVDEISVE